MNDTKLFPKLNEKKEDCCGCTACYSICPVNAINMIADNEGFFYPKINTKKCIKCKRCINICQFKKAKENLSNKLTTTKYPEIFAFKHSDYHVRINSMSGGAFTAFSDEIIENDGVVYGCIMKDNYTAIHERAETFEERNNMRGSKYIQSNMQDIFSKVKDDLIIGRKVMFTGTPCQVDGLKSFLNTDYDNLLCIDILCYGVPSPLVWKNYLLWLENRYNANSISKKVIFRNKKFGWDNHIETINMKKADGKNIEVNSEIFRELFHGEYVLRPSCYKCPYTSFHRLGNITIADFWGINSIIPGINDNKGISMVFVNDKKGENLFNNCKEKKFFYKVKLEDAIQRSLREPAKKPKDREKFWIDFDKNDFSYIVEKYVINKDTDIKVNKFRQYYFLLNKWIQLKQKRINFEEYFIKRGYRTIAIYGMGEIGTHLLEELKGTDINIKCVIDKENISLNIPIIKNVTNHLNVDAIVVTPIFAFDSIKNEIEKLTNISVISIEEIVFGLDM